jgi:hypothetical protein
MNKKGSHMTKLLTVLIAVVFSASAFAVDTKLLTDAVKIGKPGSSANKRLVLGPSGELRKNVSSGKLEFSHDGVSFVELGKSASPTVSLKTTNYTVTNADDLIPVDASSGQVTITLQLANISGNRGVEIMKVDNSSNHVRVIRAGSDLLSGDTSWDITELGYSQIFTPNGSTSYYVH